MIDMAATWKDLKNELSIRPEDEAIIALEKDIIKAMVAIREERGLTQTQMAELCNMKQPVLARMESAVHSPQVDSLLKVLFPLGYTLKIVPLDKK
jgi:Helix-turn-helix.